MALSTNKIQGAVQIQIYRKDKSYLCKDITKWLKMEVQYSGQHKTGPLVNQPKDPIAENYQNGLPLPATLPFDQNFLCFFKWASVSWGEKPLAFQEKVI